MTLSQARISVWFDSRCPLCVREIAVMRRLDWLNRVAFVDIYTLESCPLDAEMLLNRFHAKEPGRPIVSGAEAFAALWRHLPLLRLFGELARAPIVLRWLEAAYAEFLTHRPKLQRLFKWQ